MGKILFFILGLIGGLALAVVLYLQASAKYNAALEGNSQNASSTLTEAQTLWPPYMIDSHFQKDLKKFQGNAANGPSVTIYLAEDASTEDAENLVNQLEVMEGVIEVRWNTLERPLEYINNMTRLPESKDEIRDNIVVITNGAATSGEVIEFAKLQEVVDTASPSQ